MNRLSKSVVALVAALGLLIASATPAPAAITGGTLTMDTITLDLAATAMCGAATLTLTATSATAGTMTLAIPPSAFTYSSVNFVFTGTLTGTYSLSHLGGTTYFMSAHLNMTTLNAIRAASPTDPCASTGTARCAAISVSSLDLAGAANLTVTQPVTGNLQLSGSRPMSAFGCTVPFSALNSKTLAINSLTAN